MDNKLFNVNGEGDEMLTKAIELAFLQCDERTTCDAWIQSKEHGLILMKWKTEGSNELPSSLTSKEVMPIVLSWLKGEFAKDVIKSEWCDYCDHDGSNGDGWQVYTDDWGCVGEAAGATICAIKPAIMWYGK